MSDELKDAIGAGDSEIFKGYTLYPPGLPEIREAQEACARAYVLRVEKSALVHAPSVANIYRQQAANNLRSGFDYGGDQFNSWATSPTTVAYLAWLCIRKGDKTITEARAIEIIGYPTDEQMTAVWSLWRYRKTKKELAEQTKTGPTTGSAAGGSPS